jgi:hypothetical protein
MIEQLNNVKAQHLHILFEITMMTANLLIANCLINKKIEGFVNKMFKMADGYLQEHNARSAEKLNRNYINNTFENYKRKKEAQSSLLQG